MLIESIGGIFTSSAAAADTTPCEFWFSALVHTRLVCLWRDMSSSSLCISLSHWTPHLCIYFCTSFGSHSYDIPFLNLPGFFFFWQPVNMSPPFYPLCSYVFNYLLLSLISPIHHYFSFFVLLKFELYHISFLISVFQIQMSSLLLVLTMRRSSIGFISVMYNLFLVCLLINLHVIKFLWV